MEQYIEKSALVAEIERIMAEEMSFFKDCCEDELESTTSAVVYTRMEMLLSFLDTLEVKEVDLTWKDMSKIVSIDQQVCGAMGISDYTHNHQQAMEEVLKRFKAQKGE